MVDTSVDFETLLLEEYLLKTSEKEFIGLPPLSVCLSQSIDLWKNQNITQEVLVHSVLRGKKKKSGETDHPASLAYARSTTMIWIVHFCRVCWGRHSHEELSILRFRLCFVYHFPCANVFVYVPLDVQSSYFFMYIRNILGKFYKMNDSDHYFEPEDPKSPKIKPELFYLCYKLVRTCLLKTIPGAPLFLKIGFCLQQPIIRLLVLAS